jgi:hypothetical protein
LIKLLADPVLQLWLMLLRNLWGKKVEEKYPIMEWAVPYGIFISPFLVVWWISTTGLEEGMKPLVLGLEALQRRICGDDAVDDDHEEGMQLEEERGLLTEVLDSQAEGRLASTDEPSSKQAAMQM